MQLTNPTHPFLLYCTQNVALVVQTVIKKDVKKEEAEELKAKLEAVGAQVEIV